MDNPLFVQLFGKPPLTMLQGHMRISCECVETLRGYFDAVFDGDWEKAKQFHEQIVELENQADQMKKELRMSVPRSLFLPVPRSDLLQIVRMQDKIPNHAKDIAGLILGRKLALPKGFQSEMTEFLEASIAAPAMAMEVLDDLDNLIRSAFSSVGVEQIEQRLERLYDAEHESDLHQVKTRAALYELESSLNPIDVMMIYQIINWIGDIADESQSLGNSVLYLLAK